MYLKNRDIMLGRIEKIEEKNSDFLVYNKDGTTNYVMIDPFPEDINKLILTFQNQPGTLIVYNTKENLDFIVKNWEDLARLQTLTIIFTNPNSLQDIKWIISPYVHDKITEPASLRSGLFSMFSTVDQLSKKEAEQL